MEILQWDQEILRQPTEDWDFSKDSHEELLKLIKDMKETMRSHEGAGLAAPQVGVSKSLFMIEIVKNSRYPESKTLPFSVFINPKIIKVSRRTSYFVEGCLSVKGIQVGMTRPKSLVASWQDEKGRKYKKKLKGMLARVFLHEYDHLQGFLISDYVDEI